MIWVTLRESKSSIEGVTMNSDNRNFRISGLIGLVAAMMLVLQACAPGAMVSGDSGEDGSIAAGPPQALTDQYILQSGDEIHIQVFNDDELTMDATVNQSGSINYSYVGSIPVAGLTAAELTESITEKLSGAYLKNPSVNVTIKQYRAFFIDGEVRSPGSYAFEPGLTLAKAISLAGGMTDRGSRRRINLLREIDGVKKNYRVDFAQRIMPGDVVTVGEGLF